MFYALSRHIEERAAERIHPVFLLDEAHLLHQDKLDNLHILLNYAWDSRALLSLVLVGLPELRERLALRRNRSLYSRIHHRFEVPALTPDDTAEYLRMRLLRAGCHREVFASDAIVVLHEATLGAMRDLDRLAAHALRETARKKRKLVERDVVTRVVEADTRERDRWPDRATPSSRPITSPALASLEAAIVFAARALVHSFPAVDKVERPGESPQVATARDLVDQCDYFLAALDAHWQVMAAYLPDGHPDKSKYDDIPF